MATAKKPSKAAPEISPADALYLQSCKDLGIEPKTLDQFAAFYGPGDAQAKFSLHRIETAIKARKKGHKLNYADRNEYKHFPWMEYSAGSGFSLHVVDYVLTYTFVGARLSSITFNDAREIATVMQEDYNNYFNE